MANEPITRRVLARELVVNAATKPLNVSVPAAVAAAGLLLHTVWLLPVALVVCVAMVVATFVDGGEAARVGRLTYSRARSKRRPRLDVSRFASPIAHKLELALAEEERILTAAHRSPLIADPAPEIARLLEDLDQLAEAAQRVFDYLGGQDERTLRRRLHELRNLDGVDAQLAATNERAAVALETQLAVVGELRRQLLRFDAQMDHIAAALATIHGQIVRLAVAEELAAHDDIAEQVRQLHVGVSIAADALRDAYDELNGIQEPGARSATLAQRKLL